MHQEREKFRTYPTRRGGRRLLPDGAIVPIVVNSYGKIGDHGEAFLEVMRERVRLARGTRVGYLPEYAETVESLVVFCTASNVLRAFGSPDGASRSVAGVARGA